jgi:phospholipid transport system substrate-binding protein
MRHLLLIALVVATFAIKAGVTATQEPSQIVRQTSEKILEILNRDSEKLRNNPQEMQRLVEEVFLPVIDVKAFSKLTLGHNWSKATQEQRQRFIKEFKGMLMRTYTKYLVDYSGVKVQIMPKKGAPDPKRRVVYTEIVQPGKPSLPVDYSFWFNDGEWKAYNVTVDGLSLVHLFRTDFNREINETSLDALIERLAKTNLEQKKK